MAAAQFLTILAGVIAITALGIYVFGIPPEYKRKLERQALKTMGENKMSYIAKGNARLEAIATLFLTTDIRQTRSTRFPIPTKRM